MAYTYRKITPEAITPAQFDQIVEIESHCGMEPYTPEMLADCIKTLDTFACFNGDDILGFLTANPHSRYFGGSLYIVNLNVAPAYRGRGIATRLIYQLTTGYRHIFVTLDVMKTNPAMKLYQRLGFRISDLPSRNGDTDVVMYALLSQLKETIPPLIQTQDPPGTSIRPAVLGDMPRLGHIMSRSFRAGFAPFISPETLEACAVEENCAALLEGLFREGKMQFLTDGKYGMLVWTLHGNGEAEIMAIHTLPESWGTGLGHALLTRALEDIGDRPVFLWAFAENRRARRFYEKHGLRFDGAQEVRYILTNTKELSHE